MDSFAGSEIMFIYIHFQISNHPTAMPKSNIVLLHMASLKEEFTKWMWLSTMALTAFSAVTNTHTESNTSLLIYLFKKRQKIIGVA
jgi:hypothetical protein